MRAVALAIAALVELAWVPGGRADRREASVHAQLVGGVLTTGDVDAGAATARAPLAGLAVRASYATRDRYQYDVALALLRGGAAVFPDHTFTPPGRPAVTGPYRAGNLLTRLDAGLTFRLGVRWIPTARLAAGVQLRRTDAAQVEAEAGTFVARDPRLTVDLVGTVALGLDHRVNRRLIVGVAAGGSLAVPTGGTTAHSLEVTVHGAYYWYPRW